jgi:DNA ligase (NAD+)
VSKYTNLVNELVAADKAYATGDSIMSNAEYDMKKDRLREADPNNPYLEDVGDYEPDTSDWEKHTHVIPLGSLAKVTKEADLKKWVPDYPCVIEEKLDGTSIALTYAGGQLIRAVTRGKDGVGFDITRNVLKMKNVKPTIPEKQLTIIRAEIMLLDEDFDNLPADRKGKNSRNCAAGFAKELKGDMCHTLTLIVYDVLNGNDLDLNTELDALKFLKNQGFSHIVVHKVCHNFQDIKDIIEQYTNVVRKTLNYIIDGLVLKNNKIDYNDDWRKPKNKIAWKFASQETSTILNTVSYHVKGARIQPMAHLDPVDIDGVTISKASLHNWKIVEALGITAGAEVIISRRNDVIPQVEQVIKPGYGDVITAPTECPVCGTSLEWEKGVKGNDTDYLICPNDDCDAKSLKAVKKWLQIHDTKGIADKTVRLLYDNGIFNSLSEFLLISEGNKDNEILALDKMGQSKLDTLKEQIEMSRATTNVVKFFAGLNFHNAGRRVFDHICETIFEYENVIDLTTMLMFLRQPIKTGLCNVEGFAEPSAAKLQEEINDRIELITELSNIVTVSTIRKPEEKDSNISEVSFCFTGTLGIKRKDAEKMVKDLGGLVKGVSKELNYLVTDDPIDADDGSSKMKKACKLGIKIITGQEFLDMIK